MKIPFVRWRFLVLRTLLPPKTEHQRPEWGIVQSTMFLLFLKLLTVIYFFQFWTIMILHLCKEEFWIYKQCWQLTSMMGSKAPGNGLCTKSFRSTKPVLLPYMSPVYWKVAHIYTYIDKWRAGLDTMGKLRATKRKFATSHYTTAKQNRIMACFQHFHFLLTPLLFWVFHTL